MTIALRAFAFGDLATGVWGVAATGDGGTVASFASELVVDDGPDESLLASAGLELRFTPIGGPAAFAPAAAGIAGGAQLCHVEGAVHWAGSERDVACLGARATVALPAGTNATARVAAAWLGPEDGFALVALRPPGATGHDGDAVACALIEEGRPLEVDEPRFSTGYDGDGLPARAGLELWLAGSDADPASDSEDDDGGEPDEDAPNHASYPRRVAGERAGDSAELGRARAELFRWHAHGLEGAGVYVLVPAV